MDFAVVNAVVCDDIRYEINNKISLMGVFANNISVPNFPAVGLRMAVYCEVQVPERGKQYSFEMKLTYANVERMRILGAFEVHDADVAVVASPQLNVALEREGELEISVSIDNNPPIKVIKKQVAVGTVTLPLSAPPSS